MPWKDLLAKVKSTFLLNTDFPEPSLAFTETEFIHHPTLGVGSPVAENLPEYRPVVNTSKIEVDRLNGNTFVNQYLIIKDLGEGSFGKVKMVLNIEDNYLYALKAISKFQTIRELRYGKGGDDNITSNPLLSEINVMKSLQHPNVVRLYEVIDDPTSEKLVMIMEYVDGGEILSGDVISPLRTGFSERLARGHFRDLIQGLEFLHNQNIIHRDIKPGNLLVTHDGRVKLSDFGSARYFPDGDDLVTDSVGTRQFYAPEACGQEVAYSGRKADVYAAGVVLYMMIFTRPPFESENDFELLRKIREDEPCWTLRSDLSPELLDLLKKLLSKNPETRPSLFEIFNHPWVTDGARLLQILPSRKLKFPKRRCQHRLTTQSGITPSITGIFDQLPNKRRMRFKAGDYLVEEGQVLTGWHLIKSGYCEATSMEWDYEMECEIADGDSDFQEDIDEILERNAESCNPFLTNLSGSSQDNTDQEGFDDSLLSFKSLPMEEIRKGIERRATHKHDHIKQIVETAFLDHCANAMQELKLSSNGRPRGPGAVIGLELTDEVITSSQTVRALENVETIFIEKEALKEVLARPENQLPIRLFGAKLRRIEIMRNVVENLAGLYSDVVLLEKYRSMFRNQSSVGLK
eukprot:g4897.t1